MGTRISNQCLSTGPLPLIDVRAVSDETRKNIADAYAALVRGDDEAQTTLDNAVLDALDVDVDATTIREANKALVHDRLSSE